MKRPIRERLEPRRETAARSTRMVEPDRNLLILHFRPNDGSKREVEVLAHIQSKGLARLLWPNDGSNHKLCSSMCFLGGPQTRRVSPRRQSRSPRAQGPSPSRRAREKRGC